MTFFGHYPAGRAVPRAKPIQQDEKVEARRLYVESRFRPEAFKQQATDEDWRRWESEMDGQGRLF